MHAHGTRSGPQAARLGRMLDELKGTQSLSLVDDDMFWIPCVFDPEMDSITVSRPWWEGHSRMEIDEKLQVITDHINRHHRVRFLEVSDLIMDDITLTEKEFRTFVWELKQFHQLKSLSLQNIGMNDKSAEYLMFCFNHSSIRNMQRLILRGNNITNTIKKTMKIIWKRYVIELWKEYKRRDNVLISKKHFFSGYVLVL